MSFDDVWERIKEVTGLETFIDLAAAVEVQQSAVSKRRKRGEFPAEWLLSLAQKYGFSSDWAWTGEGPMKMAKHGRIDHEGNQRDEQGPAISEAPLPDDNLGFGECAELLSKIFNSGSQVLIRAIAANLHAFSEAIDNKALAVHTVKLMEQMNERMMAMERRLKELEAAPKKVANG